MATVEVASTMVALTDTVLMISPDRFGFNDQTAETNGFQGNVLEADSASTVRNKALLEFRGVVDLLKANGIKVGVCPSRDGLDTPDAIFPNNWISFHAELPDIKAILYPMLAPNRRNERQFENVVATLGLDINSTQVLDLTHYEFSGRFLEGTGSLIFDRKNKVVFAHESARTNYEVLDELCSQTGYKPVKFHASDREGKPIYHTNVVMGLGENFSVVCLESIRDTHERSTVEGTLKELGHTIIPIRLDQLYLFCGNILALKSSLGENKIIMSTSAFDAFTVNQREQLMSYGGLVPLTIPTIETVGGGSARCMLAEVFTQKNSPI